MRSSHSRLVLIAFLYMISTTFAFNPGWLYVGVPGGYIRDLLELKAGPLGKPHSGITEDALNTRYKEYFGIDKPTKSMKNARQEIQDGSEAVDDHGPKGKNEAEDAKCHFDDEEFFASNGRLIDKKAEVAVALFNNDVSSARELLGRALHTLQDFYSHSNWVDMGMPDISQKLGNTWPLELSPVDDLGIGFTPTCIACQYTVSRSIAIADADTCRMLYGGSDPMATVQKIGTAACMLGLPALLRLPFAPVEWPNCKDPTNLAVPPDLSSVPSRLLTSGWFGAEVKLHSHRPKGKCSHGGPFDRDADGLEGISKDTANRFLTPHWQLHEKAVEFAEKATIRYLDELKDNLCTTGSGKKIAPLDCAPLRRLYGVGPPLAFVIDTTGSMASVIASVRRDAIAMVLQREKSLLPSSDTPGYYILSEIQDPAPTTAMIYNDSASFIAGINKLYAHGGGDCPEFAMTGISNALDKMGPGGTVHIWTDAAAKDVASSQVIGQRLLKQNTAAYAYLFHTTACSTSEGFSFVAEGSGGQYFANLDASEASGTATLAGHLTLENRVELWILKKLGVGVRKRQVGSEEVTYDVPVDSAMQTLTLSLSGTSLSMELIRPDGIVVKGSGQVNITILSTGAIYSVSKPIPGLWQAKIRFSPASGFSLSVFGTSTLQIDSMRYLEYGGGRHDGYFPVAELPKAGETAFTAAILDGEFAGAEWELRSLDGSSLQKLDFFKGNGTSNLDIPANHFWGDIEIPSVSFNIYVSGKDVNGAPYQRVFPGLVSSQPSNLTNSTNSTWTWGNFSLLSPKLATGTPTQWSVPISATGSSNCPTCQNEVSGNVTSILQ